MQKYKVGQVLYVLFNKKAAIEPVQVSKEIIENSIEGSNVSYIVKSNVNGQMINLSEFGDEIYDSIDQLHKALLEKYRAVIDVKVKDAYRRAQENFQISTQPVATDEVVESEQEKQQSKSRIAILANTKSQLITLPDGSVAKANIVLPDSLLP